MNILGELISFVFPERCLICKTITLDFGLCPNCWNKISFISNPSCAICSYPFENETSEDLICGYCLQKKPSFDKAFAVMKYDENSKILIHKFKFNDQLHLTKIFSKWIINSISDNKNNIDIIMPVPIHKFKLFFRKYNQSALLSNEIGAKLKINTLQRALIKTKYTKPQTSLSKKNRLSNIKNTIKINEKYKKEIQNKNILIIDDVYTTGATLNECAKLLKKSGCNKVYIATIAKTLF